MRTKSIRDPTTNAQFVGWHLNGYWRKAAHFRGVNGEKAIRAHQTLTSRTQSALSYAYVGHRNVNPLRFNQFDAS